MKNRRIGYFLVLLAVFMLHPVVIAANEVRNAHVVEGNANKATQQGRRIALLIGNFTYSKLSSLVNPKHDVALMEATLRELGFDEIIGGTQRGMNLNSGDMHELLHEFGEKSSGAEVAVIFFAGHGLMSKIGSEQYLAATNTTAIEGRLEAEALSITAIMKKLSTHGAKKNFVFLDACRTAARGIGMRSITPSQDAPNTVILYATAANDFAEDGEGKNSPFTQALAAEIKQPNEWAVVQRNVIKRVLAETQERQEPKQYGGLRDEMYFNINITVKNDPKVQESQYWDSVKDSKDIADFEAYLTDYPSGQFKRLAENRVKTFKAVSEKKHIPGYIQKRLDRGESILLLSGIISNGISRLWIPGGTEPIERQFKYGQTLSWIQAVRREIEEVQKIYSVEEINERQSIINPLLQNLYKELIGDWIDKYSIKKLTIIPSNDFHSLPFAALQNDSGTYLGEESSIHVINSIEIMQYIEGKQSILSEEKSLVLTHDLVADKGRDLPMGEENAIAISKILPNSVLKLSKEGTETYFKENAINAKYIHLSGHGIFNDKNPLNSFLGLKSDALNDGKLTVGELYQMNLNSELLVLDCAFTAEGDEGVSFVRAGFKAGSRYVMASLWVQDYGAGSLLMEEFYRDYISSKDNAAALQKAQKLVRKKYPHPYFWAHIQIYG